jgi:PAS domain S-box-containing protein
MGTDWILFFKRKSMQFSKSRSLFSVLLISSFTFLSILFLLVPSSSAILILTDAENAWLQNNRDKIFIAYHQNFPPFQQKSESGEFSGLAADVLKKVEERLGIVFQKRSFSGYGALVQQLRQKKPAIVATLIPTNERSKFTLFTKPYIQIPAVLVTNKKNMDKANPADFAGGKIGAVRNSALVDYLRENYAGDFEIVGVENFRVGLRDVAFGMLDAFFIGLPLVSKTIEEEGLPNLRVAGSPPTTLPICLGISKEHPVLHAIVSRAVEDISDRELESLARKWAGMTYYSPILEKSFKIVLALVVLVVCIVLLDRLWLRKKLKVSIGELAAKNSKIESLVRNAPIGIFISTPQGTFLEANDKLAEIHGFSSAENLIHGISNIATGLFVRPEERLKMGEALKKEGFITNYEVESKRPDGTTNWVSLSMRELADEKGRVVREGFTVDITDRKRAAQALEESRSRLAIALEVAGAGSWDYYPRSGRTYFSPSWFTMLGYEPDAFEHAYQAWRDLLHPDDREMAEQFMQEYLVSRDQTSFSIQFRMRTKDGDWCWILGSGRTLEWEEDGSPSHLIGINYDIQQIKDAESKLQASEKTYRELFNAGEDAIVVLRIEDRTFVDVNQAFFDLCGYQREELLGMTPKEFGAIISPEQENDWSTLLSRVLAGETENFESQGRTKGGDLFFADVFVRKVNLNGVDRFMIVLHDITEKKMMQEVMIQTEKMMSVGGLAAGMAHEINNPLNIILQGAQKILRRTDPGLEANRKVAEECDLAMQSLSDYLEKRDFSETVESIHNAGVKAARIVENMLTFSRKSKSTLASHDLNRIIDNTILFARSDFDLKKKYDFRNIKIEKFFSDLPKVPCTETEIEQVLLNLLRNAGHALGETGCKNPMIILRTRREGNQAVIEVEDNGTGIHQDISKQIFDPFFTTKEAGVGTGLGLSVSYFIITKRHHGTIEAESKPGEWTRFVIRLPID